MKLLSESHVEAVRRVIDISGDGVNNQGRSITQAREEALAQGVVINGLPCFSNVRQATGMETTWMNTTATVSSVALARS
jgi:hypothetical protein